MAANSFRSLEIPSTRLETTAVDVNGQSAASGVQSINDSTAASDGVVVVVNASGTDQVVPNEREERRRERRRLNLGRRFLTRSRRQRRRQRDSGTGEEEEDGHQQPQSNSENATAPIDDSEDERVRALREQSMLANIIWYTSVGMLLVYIGHFILNHSIGDSQSDRSFTIPFALGVAYCGLVGSQRLNREILGCFYVCCLASVSLYVINVLLQTRALIMINNSEVTSDEEAEAEKTPSEASKPYYIAITMETGLVALQIIGSCSSLKLVRNHLVPQIRAPETGANAFAFEFVQEASRYFENQASAAEDKRLTIASIPVVGYTRERFAPQGIAKDGSSSSNAGNKECEEEEEDMCVICQDEFCDGEPIKILECEHYYHATCLDEWLDRNLACPLCNKRVTAISVSLERPQLQGDGVNTGSGDNGVVDGSSGAASYSRNVAMV